MMSSSELRRAERAAFLSAAGWSDAVARPLAGDASTRSYERLERAGRRAVLMNAPPAAEQAACPPDAGPAERRALGYNATARLAGPNLSAFVSVAAALREAGLSAPEVYAADARTGFALIEDLGDALFARAIPAGAPEATLYETAVDVLNHLRRARLPAPQGAGYVMLDYDGVALLAETGLLTDWYWAHRKGETPPPSVVDEHAAHWSTLLSALDPPSTIALRDYHAENLLWLPDRKGPRRVGLLDFQDALFGHPAYDLASLLEDARRDVPAELLDDMLDRYVGTAGLSHAEDAALRRDFAIVAAQRNAKILGIFARLFRRDGKAKYDGLLPRVEGLFRRDLARPGLEALRAFYARHFPELAR